MTMKRDMQCPNCDGREMWRLDTMMERGGMDPEPMGVLLERRPFGSARAHGNFETLICATCGYTEWYAKSISGFQHDPVSGVHFIKNDVEKAGPYR